MGWEPGGSITYCILYRLYQYIWDHQEVVYRVYQYSGGRIQGVSIFMGPSGGSIQGVSKYMRHYEVVYRLYQYIWDHQEVVYRVHQFTRDQYRVYQNTWEARGSIQVFFKLPTFFGFRRCSNESEMFKTRFSISFLFKIILIFLYQRY